MNGDPKREWKLLVIALVVILGGSLLANAINTVGGSVDVKDVRWVGSYGTYFSALLYIPKGVSVENPAPAVLVIGGGDTNREAMQNWSLELARRGYVVLDFDKFGEGYSEGHGRKWPRDLGSGGPEALRYLHSLDIIDHDNVAMAGHSMGSSGIVRAALTYPDDYEAMVIMGGSLDPALKNAALVCGIDDGCILREQRNKSTAEIFGTENAESIEVGKVYGSFEDGTAKAMYLIRYPHAMTIITAEPVRILLNWVQEAIPAPNPIAPSNQIWLWKYFGALIAMVGFVFLFFPLGAILLRTPFFKTIIKPLPEFKGFTGKSWWLGAVLTVVVPVASLFYMATVSSKILPASNIFPMGRISSIMGWTVFGALVSIILMLINHYALKGDRDATAYNYGLTDENGKIEWCNIGKSFLLAFSLFGIGYAVLVLIYRWLLVDFRVFEVSFRLLTPTRFRIMFPYLIFWIFSYIVLGANLHGLMRPKDGKASFWRELIINIILLAPFYYLWWPLHYAPLYAGNPELFAGGYMKYWLWAFPPTLTIVASISTYYYRKTGRVYVGAFLSSLLVVWTMIAGNMID